MVTVKALDEVTLADLWREEPEDEFFWREAQERQRRLLKQLLEGALEAPAPTGYSTRGTLVGRRHSAQTPPTSAAQATRRSPPSARCSAGRGPRAR